MATPAALAAARLGRASKVAELASEARAFTPAGYLPAPPVPRFISRAEEAAARLPASIKAESVRNALIKGGAKPAELDYAGLDGFVADRAGTKVSAADVLSHLRSEGPLERIVRVDQRRGTKAEIAARKMSGEPPETSSMREPFNEQQAYPRTMYHKHTEQGVGGDYSGYREVLFGDNRNDAGRPGRVLDGLVVPHRMMRAGPIDAHNSTYWMRYHSNPDAIAVQNVQSDAGQNWSRREADLRRVAKRLGVQPYSDEMPAAIEAEARRLLSDLARAPDDEYDALYDQLEETQMAQQHLSRLEAGDRAQGDKVRRLQEDWHRVYLDNESMRWAGLADMRDSAAEEAAGEAHDAAARIAALSGNVHAPESPLVQEDRWKDFLARQIVLQAAAEGKPITLPTGANANLVEGMPIQAATVFYEKDFPSRIEKVLKEFDPQGGGASSRYVGQAGDMRLYGPAPRDGGSASEASALNVPALGSVARVVPYTNELDGLVRQIVADAGPDDARLLSLVRFEGKSGDGRRLAIDKMLDTLSRSPEIVAPDQQPHISRLYGVLERARSHPVPVVGGERPGTHITMTPVARRNILERGMPIMSVIPAAAIGASQGGVLDGLKETR